MMHDNEKKMKINANLKDTLASSIGLEITDVNAQQVFYVLWKRK